MSSEVLVSTPPGSPEGSDGPLTPTQGRNIATSRAIPPTAAIICPGDNLPIRTSSSIECPTAGGPYFLRLPEERFPPLDRDFAGIDLRDELDFFEAVAWDDLALLAVVDLVVDLARVEAERLAVPDREELFLDEDRLPPPDFLAVERFVLERVLRVFLVVEPPEREPPLERVFGADPATERGGDGAAGGALATATVVVEADATATNGWKPSSASAIRPPAVIATAAARPRKMPIFSVGDPATIRQRIRRIASEPSMAVTPPRRTGMFTR
jgi:hypothetical protein